MFGLAAVASLVFAGSALAVTVTNYSPTSGLPNKAGACPGNAITITGTGFAYDGATSALAVTFGSSKPDTVANGGIILGSDTTIYAVTPADATTGPIVVTTAAGSASTASISGSAINGVFFVNPCPQVSLATATANPSAAAAISTTPSIYKVAPASGKVGTAVKITGTSMLGVSGVQFGGVSAKFTAVSATEIDTTVPKGAKSGALTLTYSITASTSQGGITPTNAAGNSSCAKCTAVWMNIGLGKARTFKVS